MSMFNKDWYQARIAECLQDAQTCENRSRADWRKPEDRTYWARAADGWLETAMRYEGLMNRYIGKGHNV